MASVTLKGVQKVYQQGGKDVTAVHGVDLDVKDGELVVLVGPSGCGKSTTLRMVAGLESITAGELFIGDRKVNDVPANDRDIAMVFQSYALYPHMTAYENMAFALKLRGMPKAEIDAAGEGGGGDPRDRASCSSGGRRSCPAGSGSAWRWDGRSCASRRCSCSMSRCRISTRSCACRRAARSRGCISSSSATMIYVTHDQVEAMTLGDRIVVMRAGT